MRKIAVFAIYLFFVDFIHAASENDRFLSLPEKKLCDNRFMEAKYEGKNFFYSGHDPELANTRLDWLDARNECRRRCMETLTFKDQKKFDFFKDYIQKNNISFIWTSGRLCDFAGCEGRWDLLPKRIKGWLWSADQTRIDDTNKIPSDWSYTPWSRTGHFKKPQPDNAEFFISQVGESCLGVLNNQYNDSVAWHDIACYHKARFICEDSEALLYDVEHQDEEEVTEASTSTTTTKKTPIIRKIVKTTTEATQKQIETTEKLESSSTKSLDITKLEKSTTTKAPEVTKSPKYKRPIPRRRKVKASTTISTTTPSPTTTEPETTEKSKQPLDSPSNDIQLEDTTIALDEETTTEALTTTTTTTKSPFRRKFPRRTRRKLKNL